MRNPFVNRGIITDPTEFFGRREQLSDILSRLGGMQSCSVVGERRSGKSSLLYYLTQTGARQLDNTYRFVYVDFQDAHYHTATRWMQTILHRVGGDAVHVKGENTLRDNLIRFREEIDKLSRNGRRIVLCLDEFENTFDRLDQFTDTFFDDLRSQLSTRNMAFVTATKRPLRDLCLSGKLTSPFYNVFTRINVGEFTEAEAQEFLTAQNEIVHFSETELKFIAANLQRHPLKLQIECDFVYRNREFQLSEPALAERITEEFANFLVGQWDPKRLLRLKKTVNLDDVMKVVNLILKSA